jgi:SMI1 / KNR4 family (SUKH-1)
VAGAPRHCRPGAGAAVRSPPADEEHIAQAEARLGIRFPPSYRTFLSVSDGWRPTSPFVDRLFGVAEFDRFAALNPHWVDAYGGGHELDALIQVSDVDDTAVLLLNPSVVAGDGEWEAWFWATWGPDEDRYRSFEEPMRAQAATFERVVEPRPEPRKKADAAVKRARAAALNGEVDEPQRVLSEAAEGEHRIARILLVQLLAFQHRWQELIPHAVAVLTSPWEGPANVVWEDLYPALARAATETGRWRDADAAVVDSVVGRRILEAMRSDGGIDADFPDYPNEPFNAAVKCAKSRARRGRPDDAFALVLDALPQWLSFRLDNLAPTALIADRDLGSLITPERGRALLATPRGQRQP